MLYIIRHGLTDWNLRHKLQGQTDVPLNEQGMQMAREAAARYRDVHFDLCYCSPLRRARQTAALLLEGRDVPILYDDRLKEMYFGQYEGTENCSSIPDCPLRVLFQHPEQYTAPTGGAERLEQLFDRTGQFLRELALPQCEAGKDVLIVGHGAMNSSIVCQIRNLPVSDFWKAGIENCRLMRLI